MQNLIKLRNIQLKNIQKLTQQVIDKPKNYQTYRFSFQNMIEKPLICRQFISQKSQEAQQTFSQLNILQDNIDNQYEFCTSNDNKNTPDETSNNPNGVQGNDPASSEENLTPSDDDIYPGGKDSELILRTIPLKDWKDSNLSEKDKKLKQQKIILFSSPSTILPNSTIRCQMKTGNLKEVDHQLGYFLLNDLGEVYLVGLTLDKKIQSDLKKQMKSSEEFQGVQQQINVDISAKKMTHRLRIVEIKVSEDGIYAYTIPYKDYPQNKHDKEFNLENELELIKQNVGTIKKSLIYEKIDIFNDMDLEKNNIREFTNEQIDSVLFKIINSTSKVFQRYLKNNLNTLIQRLFESRSIIQRVIIVRMHLESLQGVMEIVNQNFKMADDNMIKMHTQSRAKLAQEYIRQNYLYKDQFGQSNNQPSQMFPQQGQSKKQIQTFEEKLDLIEDQISKEKVEKEIQRFSQIDKHSTEFSRMNLYLDEVFSIPWKQFTPPFWDIQYAKEVLDKQIYGLEKVKERIIQMIAVNQLKKVHEKSKGFVLLLYGPPGTGKTSIAKAVAESLKKTYRFISFAGVNDPYYIKGHRRTYVDSQPGIFIKELIKAKTMNPVFIIDEIDKMGKGHSGADPYYSLLEILNPEESQNFTDHYLDIKVDFSNTIFILTANEVLHMLEPLRNRLEVIEIPSYIEEEKLNIGQKYIIPKVLENHGIPSNLIKFDNQTISNIIKGWCYYESGVRQLKRCFESISRKRAVELLSQYPEQFKEIKQTLVLQESLNNKSRDETTNNINNETKENQSINVEAKGTIKNNEQPIKQENKIILNENNKTEESTQEINSQEKDQFTNLNLLSEEHLKQYNFEVLDLTQDNQFDLLKKYLGNPQFDSQQEQRDNKEFPVGTLNVLTVGGFTGQVLTVEMQYDYTQPEKKGLITSSGNLKAVLKESLTIAKINAFRFLSEEKIKEMADKNVHVHFMSGAVPKDGPSAGGAICSSYLSLALNKKIPSDLAMTGELSLNGDFCKIGGLQAKIIAAKSINIKTIIAPYSNLGEALEFPQLLLENLTLYFVKDYSQIYDILFKEHRESEIPAGTTVIQNGKMINIQNYSLTSTPQQQIMIQENRTSI